MSGWCRALVLFLQMQRTMRAELQGAAYDGRPEKAERCVGAGGESGRGAPQKRRDLSWAFISNGESLGMVAWLERTSCIKAGG